MRINFLGKKELFEGLKIDALEKDWKTYPVFHLDFNGKDFIREGELEDTLTGFVKSRRHSIGATRTAIPLATGSRMFCMPPTRRRGCAA